MSKKISETSIFAEMDGSDMGVRFELDKSKSAGSLYSMLRPYRKYDLSEVKVTIKITFMLSPTDISRMFAEKMKNDLQKAFKDNGFNKPTVSTSNAKTGFDSLFLIIPPGCK